MPITHVNGDLARQFTTTTGTGTLSMGTVPTSLRSIVAAVGSGKKARFKLSSSNGTDWEIFEGTATAGSPDTVTRDTVIASTNGGAKIVLPAGTHTLDCTWIAKSADEATPRLLTVGNGLTLASGTLTVDCMGACDVFAVLPLTANVTSVAPPQNVPERCSLYLEVVQSGGPWTFPQGAWPAGTVLDTAYNLYTDTTKSRFWWTTTDGGTTATLECNGPTPGAIGDAYATSHEADTTAHPASSIVNTPAGNIVATTVQAAINELDSEKEPSGAVAIHAALTQAHGISAFGATLVDDVDAATARATLGIGASISDGSTLATGLIFPGTGGIKLRDTNGTNTLALQWDVDDTADRTLTFRTSGANRTVTVSTSSITLTALLAILASANGGAAAANKMPYFDGAITGQLADLTVDARTLLALVFAANTIPVAATANTLIAQAVGASEVVGRRATGNIGSISYANLKTDLALNNVANVDQLPRSADTSVITANTTIDSTYNGKTIDCNNSGAVTLTLADAITANFQCYILRRNTGTVAIARQTTGTLNGATTSISISAQWKSAFVFAYGTGTFAVDAG